MTQENGEKVEETPPEEPQSPTPEEQLKELQAQFDQERKERERWEESYKTLQRTHQRSQDGGLKAEIADLKETQRIMAAMLSERGRVEDDESLSPKDKEDYLKRYDDLVKEQETKRKTEESQREQQEYAVKADTLWKEAQELFAEDDNALDSVLFSLSNGFYDRAEARVAKARVKKPEGQKEEESEEKRIERLAEEKLKQELEKRGLLEEFSSEPSGDASDKTWKEEWSSGKKEATPANIAKAKKLLKL